MNLTLFQLNNLVRQTIELTLDQHYWVEAELSECRESNGHCYMDLIQKDPHSNVPVARAQARCWRSSWMQIRPRFERITRQQLHAGMKVLLKVKPQFHEAYGFSWIVDDIDPTYTMGDMARKRQEIINALKEQGVFELNKELPIPLFCKRIAVISSQTAAGYGDFCNQLADNEYGFQFQTRLFPAIMQGEQVEGSIIAALNLINDSIDDFDVVVIIRGGGGTSDLSGFDALALAENVANFPLPIITGIGHDRDESVLDMISCVRVKTPTAAADYLINHLLDVLERIDEASRSITMHVRQRLEAEKIRISHLEARLPIAFAIKKTQEQTHLDQLSTRINAVVNQRIAIENNRLAMLSERIPLIIKGRLDKGRFQLDMLQQRTNALDPIHILRRGYSIVLHDGIAVKSPNDVKPGDELSIMMAEGVLKVKSEE